MDDNKEIFLRSNLQYPLNYSIADEVQFEILPRKDFKSSLLRTSEIFDNESFAAMIAILINNT